MLITVVAGQPVITTSNFTLVGFRVTVAVPAQLASASVTAFGATSFDDFNSALKTLATVGDGEAVALGDGLGAAAGPPQAATKIAAPAMPANMRMFSIPPWWVHRLYESAHRSDDEAEQAYKH